VNYPSPGDLLSGGHVWITIWCRYGRDPFGIFPAAHRATPYLRW
jgi:hypothetical protein